MQIRVSRSLLNRRFSFIFFVFFFVPPYGVLYIILLGKSTLINVCSASLYFFPLLFYREISSEEKIHLAAMKNQLGLCSDRLRRGDFTLSMAEKSIRKPDMTTQKQVILTQTSTKVIKRYPRSQKNFEILKENLTWIRKRSKTGF